MGAVNQAHDEERNKIAARVDILIHEEQLLQAELQKSQHDAAAKSSALSALQDILSSIEKPDTVAKGHHLNRV